MNVIFLDIDGVLLTVNYNSDVDLERRIKVLADICHEYNCKIVIESSHKDAIDEETLQPSNNWIKYLLNLFKKYNIEFIGRTPNVKINLSSCSYISIWKELEIRLYLFRHPEIDHYCIIDDDDAYPKSDLNKVRDHLVTTINLSDNPEEEGLLPIHKDKVGNILEKENEIKKFALKKSLK